MDSKEQKADFIFENEEEFIQAFGLDELTFVFPEYKKEVDYKDKE